MSAMNNDPKDREPSQCLELCAKLEALASAWDRIDAGLYSQRRQAFERAARELRAAIKANPHLR